MVKHNNVIPNEHFRKHWQNYVKTWFNQPARKTRRRLARQKKAVKIFPRPTAGPLRPIVHGQTAKYNMKLRAGKGFYLEELKATGIAIDHRRRNHSLEGLQTNVQRLKTYKANLVVNPRRHNIPLPLFRPQDREHNRLRRRDHEVVCMETRAKIHIRETVSGCDKHVVMIYNMEDEVNELEESGKFVCLEEDALLRIHQRVVAEVLHGRCEVDEEE